MTDKRIWDATANTAMPEVVSLVDYFPYGMHRNSYSSKEYRYGFQGQEKDDEVKGAGLSVNYKYRMHDPRLGRFFAVDPLAAEYPYNGQYNFSENRVIDGVELEGLEYEHYTISFRKNKPVLLRYKGKQKRKHAIWEFFDNGNDFETFNGDVIKEKAIIVHVLRKSTDGIAGWGVEGSVHIRFETKEELYAWAFGGYLGKEGLVEAAEEAAKERMKIVVASSGNVLAHLYTSGSANSPTVSRISMLRNMKSLHRAKAIALANKLKSWAGATRKAMSKTARGKFKVASVVYDRVTGKMYFGMNRGIRLKGSKVHSVLKSKMPAESLTKNKFIDNCAECDAFNQALHDKASWENLEVLTVGVNKNGTFFYKPQCANCTQTFKGVTELIVK